MFRPRSLRAMLLLGSLLTGAPAARSQSTVKEITAAQNSQAPYFYTGRLVVTHGTEDYFGTATLIRRYTALTCGHLLYNGETGFSTNLRFDPHFYLSTNSDQTSAAMFGVLSGYQSAAYVDGNSDPAFARDLGYVLFVRPAPRNDWADWEVNPNALEQSGDRLVIGYAAESFPGDMMAAVSTSAPYSVLRDGLYESTDYYTQEGMSGGPLYLFDAGKWQVVAETVAGTSPPDPALSDVRAITEEARSLLIEPEYVNQLVESGFIKGAPTVSPGSTVNYKCGVIFTDGAREGTQLPKRYAELKLKAAGPNKSKVSVSKMKTGKYQVKFNGLGRGQSVVLRLLRDTLPNGSQTPLAETTVTAQ